MKRLCVFCGSKDGASPKYREAAAQVGQELARRGIELVYGGAQNGLMGALADAVLDAGGTAHGVIPHGLARDEFAHPKLSKTHFVDSMHERKAVMESLSDGFLALPGGFGTLDELFEALTWAQLGIHQKPIGLLDTAGYYAPLLDWVDHSLRDGFVAPQYAELLLVEREPAAMIDRLLLWQGPAFAPRWITRAPAP